MQASWDMAIAVIKIDGLADMLGERHRIIANDWQAAHMNGLMSCLLDRAADILEAVEFTPAAVRADLRTGRSIGGRLYSAGQLISHAADVCSDSAGLVRDDERRWRAFRQHVTRLVSTTGNDATV